MKPKDVLGLATLLTKGYAYDLEPVPANHFLLRSMIIGSQASNTKVILSWRLVNGKVLNQQGALIAEKSPKFAAPAYHWVAECSLIHSACQVLSTCTRPSYEMAESVFFQYFS